MAVTEVAVVIWDKETWKVAGKVKYWSEVSRLLSTRRGGRADLIEPTEPTSRILIGPSYQMQPSDWPVGLKDGVSSRFYRGLSTPISN